ncbi:uncharacterized protein [Tiliqua scincoides]|uniref:uncharacterized protein n=1 Tax=Tiliqua scincoides TaxID=71010 RepID=UPI0034617D70
MHRAYQPLFPATSRYLQEKWDKASYQEHRRKVELATPVVNTTALPTPLHLQVNLKKKQLEKERHAVWDRENLLHCERLWGIKKSRGRVDNWNFYSMHSLNKEKRRQDLAHMCWENQQLLKRLEGRKSELAREHWQQDWYKEELLRNSIACYPRSTGSCQTRKERRRQWTVSSSVPVSAAGDSRSTFPDRTCVPCSSKNNSAMSKSSWGSGSRREQSGALALRLSKGTRVSAKIVLGGFSPKRADGSLVRMRADVPGESCLEKPLGEVVMYNKPPTSLHLGEQLRPCDNSLIPTSRGLEKKPEVSVTNAELCWRKTERAPKLDGQSILLNILSVKSPLPFARKSPEGTCGKNDSISPSEILPTSARCEESSLLTAKICESSSSPSSSSPSDT